jgi:hypothetical protein
MNSLNDFLGNSQPMILVVEKNDVDRLIKALNEKDRLVSSEQKVYSITEATAVSGICKTKLYYFHNIGRLPFVKLGRKTLIRHNDLMELLNNGTMEE